MISSPALRCADTIELGCAATGQPVKVNWDRRIYLASGVTLADVLRDQEGDPASILMVGHNPGLEDLILMLVPDVAGDALRDEVETKFPTAAAAELQFEADSWSAVTTGKAKFTRLIRPRDLDPNLGPQMDRE